MKIKQIVVSFLLFAVVSMGTTLLSGSTAVYAAESCENLYNSTPTANDKAKAKATQQLRACKKGAQTNKCDGFKDGSGATKKDKEAACANGQKLYVTAGSGNEGGSDGTGAESGGGSTVLDDPVAGDDCGGVKTAIIKCTADNSGPVQKNGIWGLLLIVINVMTAGVGVLAVAGIVYGAILYTTAEDKADQVKKATDIITNVVIGLVVFALMYAGLNFIIPGGVFAS